MINDNLNFRIPAHVSMDAAALLEPLSVAIHATRRAAIEQGDTAVVFGAGTVGLLVAAMAKMSGATTVVIADLDSGRVNYAIQNGFATKGYVVTPRRHLNEIADKLSAAKALSAEILQRASLNDPDFEGADVTFDCTGKEICMQAGLYVSNTRPSYRQTLTQYIGYKTRWKASHGRYGHPHSDITHVCLPFEGGRYYWHFPLRKHVSHWYQDYLLWGFAQFGQHDNSSIQRAWRR